MSSFEEIPIADENNPLPFINESEEDNEIKLDVEEDIDE